MENNDKIFDQFKNAAENVAPKEFQSMENVWNRIEDKLDQKVLKKETKTWRKIAVAASILLCVSIGYQVFKSSNELILPENNVVTNEKSKKLIEGKIQKSVLENDQENTDLKINIDIILQKPILVEDVVAYQDAPAGNMESQMPVMVNEPQASPVYEKIEIADKKENLDKAMAPILESKKSGEHFFKTKIYDARGVKQTYEEVSKQEVVAIVKQETKKQNPLYVIDGESVANNKNKDAKDKLTANNIENIVVLKEPLYIINGVEYSEESLFGAKPTSPYAPLDQQEIIKTVVFQGDEAVELYGEKGRKGVVVVTTKNGKPVKN